MSHIVFSEGRHDVDLLSLTHDRRESRNYDTFIDRESDDSQDQRVRQHKVDLDTDYLYKAEGGRSKVIKKFRSHATEFGNVNLYLLVDFDMNGLADFANELHQKLGDHYGDVLKVDPHRSNSNQHMEFFDCDILLDRKTHDHFKLMAFKDDLEAVTGITGSEGRAKQREKIDSYLDNTSNIYSDICDFLY